MRKWGLILFPFIAGVLYAGDTTIKGKTMELVDKGDIVRFNGDVVLTRGTDVIKANQMETSKHRDKVTAKGDVQLLRTLPKGETLKAYGQRGYFDTQSGEGYLLRGEKPSHVVYNQVVSSTITRVMDVYANRFDFSQTNSTGLATGDVIGTTADPETGSQYKFWSSSAAIDQNTKMLKLSGPQLSRIHEDTPIGHREVEGDVITCRSDGRTILAEGNARAVFIDEIPNKEHSHGTHRP